MLDRPRRRDRRIPHPAHHLCRRLRVGDGRVRRSRAAGHDVSRTPRLHLPARPSDLRCRQRGRCDPPAGRRRRDRDVRPFQDVLLDLGARLGLPGLVDEDGAPRYPAAMRDTSSSTNARRASACSPDGAARTATSTASARRIRSSSNATSSTAASGATSSRGTRATSRWRTATISSGRSRWASSDRPSRSCCSSTRETLQKFRLAAQGPWRVAAAGCSIASASRRYFDPLPFWYAPFERAADRREERFRCPRSRQRPMFMYHAWGSQNAWLRQIATRNALYVHPDTAAPPASPTATGSARRATRPHPRAGEASCEPSQPDTVWTWNAIGKRKGAWKLATDAPEAQRRFPAQPPDRRAAPRDGGGYRTRTRIRSPVRRRGSTCACAIEGAARTPLQPQFAPSRAPELADERCRLLHTATRSRPHERTPMTTLPPPSPQELGL